jgi:hypothetical protein
VAIRSAPVAPGVGLAYDNAAAKLEDQQAQIGEINRRFGGVVLAAVALCGFFLSGLPASWVVRVVVIAILAVVVVESWLVVRIAEWKDAPDPREFARLANLSPEEMKGKALATLLDAYEVNAPRLKRKGRLINIAAATEGIALASLMVGRAIGG